jgi:hypothetical protein
MGAVFSIFAACLQRATSPGLLIGAEMAGRGWRNAAERGTIRNPGATRFFAYRRLGEGTAPSGLFVPSFGEAGVGTGDGRAVIRLAGLPYCEAWVIGAAGRGSASMHLGNRATIIPPTTRTLGASDASLIGCVGVNPVFGIVD